LHRLLGSLFLCLQRLVSFPQPGRGFFIFINLHSPLCPLIISKNVILRKETQRKLLNAINLLNISIKKKANKKANKILLKQYCKLFKLYVFLQINK